MTFQLHSLIAFWSFWLQRHRWVFCIKKQNWHPQLLRWYLRWVFFTQQAIIVDINGILMSKCLLQKKLYLNLCLANLWYRKEISLSIYCGCSLIDWFVFKFLTVYLALCKHVKNPCLLFIIHNDYTNQMMTVCY